jgi:hypothetical protein
MNATDCPQVTLAEAIERLASMPAFLDTAIAGRDARSLRVRVAGSGDFSLVEHACHLRDLEREGYQVRLRRMLEEDRPELPGFAGGEVARERDYPRQDARAAAADFARARAELLAALAVLDARLLVREARFGDRLITVCGLVEMMDAHDAGHREEIARLVAALPAP